MYVYAILPTGSLLDVRFELKPLGRRADYSVKAQLKPVKIIYDAVRVANVLDIECIVLSMVEYVEVLVGSSKVGVCVCVCTGAQSYYKYYHYMISFISLYAVNLLVASAFAEVIILHLLSSNQYIHSLNTEEYTL